MQSVPWGHLITVLVTVVAVLVAWWPPPTHGPRPTPAFVLGTVYSEVPGFFALIVTGLTVLAVAEGDRDSPVLWIVTGIGVVAVVGLGALEAVAVRSRSEVVSAVDAALDGAGPLPPTPTLTRGEWVRTVLAPLRWPSYDVQVIRNLSYGPHGRANLLDLYCRRAGVQDAPVLVHLHGGGYSGGRKNREGRLLMQAAARRGWVCVSANYRLAPSARFPEFLTDAKRVIGWARIEGVAHGAGRTVVVCGGSAGANLALTAALTANRPEFQPGFEDVDTSVQAAIGLYGYYGPAPSHGSPSAPADHLRADAPPTLIVHGDRDPMVPKDAARQFSALLREASTSPVIHVELTGGLHSFDRFDSVRTGGVVCGALRFLQRTACAPERTT